jgi:AcrR family transcriptional regulator
MTRTPAAPRLSAGEVLPAPPQQARSFEKRTRILEAGRMLFGENGYEATTIGAITARAQIASGAFYIYFRSKRQLLLVLMDELVEHLRGLDLHPTIHADVRTGLRRFLAEVFRADLRYYGVVRAWQEAALADAELGERQAAIHAWTEARLRGVLRRLASLPHARADRDLPAFARLMDRHFWSLLARGARMRAKDFDRELRLAADVIHSYLFTGAIDDTGRR